MSGFASTKINELIDSCKAGNAKTKIVWDNSIPGLGLRINPSGKANFFLYYRFLGVQRKMTIGRYGIFTIAQAREHAKRLYGQIAQGTDPALKKRQAKDGSTVADLCRLYIERHAKKKRTGLEDIQKINSRIIPALGKRKLDSITFHDIVNFHTNYGAPVQANRCLALLSKMFGLAREWGLVSHSSVNPCNGVKKNPERSRSRYILETEMPKLLGEIQAHQNPFIRGALLISLFTGIRQKSVMSLEWADLDLEARVLFERRAKTSKAGEVITHSLTNAAVEVLRSIPRSEDPRVFTDGYAVETQTHELWLAWKEIKKKAGIQETETDKLWLHDLRRTVGSWLVKNNYSVAVAKNALSHKSLGAAQKYQHINDGDLVLRAMEEITQKMLATRNSGQNS